MSKCIKTSGPYKIQIDSVKNEVESFIKQFDPLSAQYSEKVFLIETKKKSPRIAMLQSQTSLDLIG